MLLCIFYFVKRKRFNAKKKSIKLAGRYVLLDVIYLPCCDVWQNIVIVFCICQIFYHLNLSHILLFGFNARHIFVVLLQLIVCSAVESNHQFSYVLITIQHFKIGWQICRKYVDKCRKYVEQPTGAFALGILDPLPRLSGLNNKNPTEITIVRISKSLRPPGKPDILCEWP